MELKRVTALNKHTIDGYFNLLEKAYFYILKRDINPPAFVAEHHLSSDYSALINEFVKGSRV